MSPSLHTICKSSKQSFDLTSAADQAYLYDLVSRIKSFPLWMGTWINSFRSNTSAMLSVKQTSFLQCQIKNEPT